MGKALIIKDSLAGTQSPTTRQTTQASEKHPKDLQVTDIESAPQRMCLKVRQGKGAQDRYTLLSPRLLSALRLYWLAYHPRQ